VTHQRECKRCTRLRLLQRT